MSNFNRAFSLIEIIVIISIMGILFAFLLPNLNSILTDAGHSKCLADLKKIKEASIIYREVNSHWPEKLDDLKTYFNKRTNDTFDIMDPWGGVYSLGWLPYNPLKYQFYDASHAYYKNNFIDNDQNYLPISDFSIRPSSCEVYVFSTSHESYPITYLKIGEAK